MQYSAERIVSGMRINSLKTTLCNVLCWTTLFVRNYNQIWLNVFYRKSPFPQYHLDQYVILFRNSNFFVFVHFFHRHSILLPFSSKFFCSLLVLYSYNYQSIYQLIIKKKKNQKLLWHEGGWKFGWHPLLQCPVVLSQGSSFRQCPHSSLQLPPWYPFTHSKI